MEAVDRVLAERGQAAERSRRAEMLALGAAALLHFGVVAVAFGLAHLKPRSVPIEFIAAQIVPAQALGVEKPRRRAETPKAEPPAPAAEPTPEPERAEEPPAPEPAPKPAPKPVPPPVPTGPLPRPKGWNDPPPSAPTAAPTKPTAPTSAPAKPAAPAPVKPPSPTKPGTATGSPGPGAEFAKGDEAGRRGSATGSTAGTSAFGSEIATLDNPDFTYGYYIDGLLRKIDANWFRPSVGNQVRAIVHFRILRQGAIDQLEIVEPSGINSFDLAALRAVQNSAPFPPLPASYKNPTLGVNLIVR